MHAGSPSCRNGIALRVFAPTLVPPPTETLNHYCPLLLSATHEHMHATACRFGSPIRNPHLGGVTNGGNASCSLILKHAIWILI